MYPSDIASIMRRRNMFGNMGGEEGFSEPTFEINVPPPAKQQTNSYDSLINQSSPSMDAYRRHLEAAPTREQYKPNIGSKISAAMAGFGAGWFDGPQAGYQTSRGIIDAPYERAYADYATKGQNLGQLAQLEAADYSRRLKTMFDLRDAERQEATAQSTIATNEARIKNWENIAKTRGLMVLENEIDGTKVVYNPTTKETIPIGKFGESLTEQETRENRIFEKRGLFTAGVNRRTHQLNRDYDVKNPIPESVSPFVQPTQQLAAMEGALKSILTRDPSFAKFIKYDDAGRIIGIKTAEEIADISNGALWDGNPEDVQNHYSNFVIQLQKEKARWESRERGPAVRDPLGAPPTIPTNDLRAKAIQEIKTKYPNRPELLTDENYIKSVEEYLRTGGS